MKLETLKPAAGAVKARKRIGRGQGSGKGGTSTKGHKGAQSRSGYSRKPGFEGGQMPLQRRIPKFGFKNPFRVEYEVINVGRLQAAVEKYGTPDKIDHTWLAAHSLIANKKAKVKVLNVGELSAKLNLHVDKISAKAKETVEAAGGSVTVPEAKAPFTKKEYVADPSKAAAPAEAPTPAEEAKADTPKEDAADNE